MPPGFLAESTPWGEQVTERKLLVAVDVDGTLLNTEFDDVLGSREIDALEQVRQAGHTLALCTGRNTRSVQGLLDKSGWHPADLPVVLLNGALVRGGTPHRQLVCNVLDRDQIRNLIPLFRDHDTVPMVYGTDEDGGTLHHESRPLNDVLGRYISVRRDTVGAINLVDDLLDLPWDTALEVGTIDQEPRIRALTAAIHATYPGRYEVINTRSLLGEGRFFWAEVYRSGSDKGSGLSRLAAELGFAHEDIVAIGDNFNDLAMFALAGCSVAMGNSPAEVQAQAHQVTDSVDRGGAAVVLEQIAAGTFGCPASRHD